MPFHTHQPFLKKLQGIGRDGLPLQIQPPPWGGAHSMPFAQAETSSPDTAGPARKRKSGRAAGSTEFGRIARACPCCEPSTVKMAGAASSTVVRRELDWPKTFSTAI